MADLPKFNPSYFGFSGPPKPLELPELEFVDLTISQIKSMSDTELLSVLSGESEHKGIVAPPLQQLITSELLSRTLANTSRPHWSVVPSFWLLVLTTILAVIAAVAAVLALPQLTANTDERLNPAPAAAPVTRLAPK